MDIYGLKTLLRELVGDMEKTVPYACALAMETLGERVVVMTRESRVEPLDPSRGVVLTVFTGREFLEYSTGELTREALARAAKELVKTAELSGIGGDTVVDPGERLEKDFIVEERVPNESVPLGDKVARCSEYRERLQGMDRRIVNAVSYYAYTQNRELFVNRSKKLFQDIRRGQAVIQAVMREGDDNAQLHEGDSRQGGYENSVIPDEKFGRLIGDCGRILGAPRLVPGMYDCIFSPEFAGITAHECFGHGTETDIFFKTLSPPPP